MVSPASICNLDATKERTERLQQAAGSVDVTLHTLLHYRLDYLSRVAFSAIFSLSKPMYRHTQQSGDEHSEAVGPYLQGGNLPEAFGAESEARRSYFFQVPFLHGLLGGTPLHIQTCRAGQASAPIEAAGVVEHPSGPQL